MKNKKTVGILLIIAIIFSLCSCFNVTVTPGVSGGASPSSGGNTEYNGSLPSETNTPEISESDFSAETEPSEQEPSSEEPEADAPGSTEPETADAPKAPDQMNSEELLSFFNSSLNAVKNENTGFNKSKLTSVEDIQLSNSAANALVGVIKGSLLSETADKTAVNRGESGINVMSPSGKTYVSMLTPDDITSISCTSSENGYVITVAVKGEVNPGDGSSMSRVFDFITVDDVVNIYAPQVNATVAENDIEVVFSDCTATLTVSADGEVRGYSTYVKAVINMYNASIKRVVTINSDLAITLSSTTDYTDFAY